MRCKKSAVPLADTDTNDSTFRITTRKDAEALAGSIQATGLLHPPLLRQKETGHTVVAGFRRIEACKKLGFSEIEARVVPPDADKLECVRYAITDNAFQRPLDQLEISRCLSMLSEFFKDGKTLAREASKLGLPGNPSVIGKLAALAGLPESIQNGVASGAISLVAALELGKLEPDDAIALAKMFIDLKPSLNKQREIITHLREVAIRDGANVSDLLGEGELTDILENGETDRNLKIASVRSFLRKKRFPALSEAEKIFGENVRKLSLGNRAKLIPPANFEGTVYTLNLQFKDVAELRQHRQTLDSMIQNPAIHEILK